MVNAIHKIELDIIQESEKSDYFNKARMLPKSSWYEDDTLTAYVRVGGYGAPEGIRLCITLANIVVKDRARGNGHGINFINGLRSLAELYHFDYFVVECIQNDYLKAQLVSNNYKLIGDICPNAYFKCHKGE